MGQLELLRQRDTLRAKLGDAFDLKSFHKLVLQAGAIPLDLLPKVTSSLVDGAAVSVS